MTTRVFSSATGLLAVVESFASVPYGGGGGQIDYLFVFVSFFSQASTMMAEAITMIQARTSWIFSGVLHS